MSLSSDISSIISGLEEMHPEAACALKHNNTFELLISVVLSAQTTDISVNKVTPELFRRYPDAYSLAAADPDEVADIIRTIGLYKNKSSNIVKLSGQLVREYGGVVPCDEKSLTGLAGVGRKTANVVLAEGFGIPRIAVDTHVFRVANRIGLADSDNVTGTEEQLMKVLPEDMWIRAHHLLIFHGRKCCTARKPHCGECSISGLCSHHQHHACK